MASKFGMAGGIPERRVRPIWDAIDSRQFKNALKHSTALLAKYPNSPYALALKALILERMGKSDEALSVCLNLNNCFMSAVDMATSCYEYACGKFPNNMELMMGLFNCYVCEYSFVKQQQIAIKMYKIVGEERFLLWAVCSIQLQVLCGNGGEKLLLLAEGLLKKHIASHSLHEPEALIVYISLLEQQSKFGDALEILSGKLGSLIMIEVDRLRIQGRLLARAGDYAFDSRISNASAFVQKLMASATNESIRCPYLANLEIERRKLLFGKGDEDKLMEALMQYFLRFGHLFCFTSDVEAFLQVLTREKRMQFVEKLMETSETPATMAAKALGKSLTLFKIQESVGNFFTLPVSDLEPLAVQMVEMYCKNLPLSKDLDVQESMHGEELLSMVSNILVQLFWRTKHLGYLVESVMILLVHLYSHWAYKSLDVKNILLETVSHHILPQMLISPLWVDLGELLRDYLRFMDDHFRESADLTFLAYRHRNYSKVIEFVQFKERLQRSNQYLVAKIEAPILQLKQNADKIEEEEKHQIKQTEGNVPKAIERRSLLPRMIYLSIQCASSSLKENIETNGSVFDAKISLELKMLLGAMQNSWDFLSRMQ
ncbi:N-terminal acetyltransferase B complex auxiliary subunit NAA25 [Camellia lanceoleosa]|uniref:N-terminal acetyltransferase B complex auxiliary subunit NAA25 n=1 Tax=Camellia lanceoleosa TaxID=1840588 RepID=A0ACC0F1I7_9ERIC|nr:N-terminal acetyltransferase B complex auxiliary subunit NAA25 [Camellia lanceoleosa]